MKLPIAFETEMYNDPRATLHTNFFGRHQRIMRDQLNTENSELTRRSVWTAKMIAPDCDAGQGTQASYVHKTIDIDVVPTNAQLHISAQGLYRCFINNVRVGNDVLTPGWVNYDNRLPFQTYDVSQLLRAGSNRVEIWLGDGWHRSQLMWDKGHIFNCWGNQVSAIAEITSGDKVIAQTDSTWKSGLLPILKSGIYHGEDFDARIATQDPFKGVTVVEFDPNMLTLQECDPVRELSAHSVQHSFKDQQGRTIYDFGQNAAGYVRFTVEGDAGAKVRVEHAEVLGPDQFFDNRNYRSARAELTYVLAGDGAETYQPTFTFQGFRYARVTIEGAAEITNIEMIPITSVPDLMAGFECANPLVNRLVQNTIWSQRANFIEVPTDCPQRDERLGWTGDAQVFAPTACYLADSQHFLRKYLRDVMVDQRPNGAIAHFSPDPSRLHPENYEGFFGSTGWGDVITVVPWTLYVHYGDRQILAECYEAMNRWMDFVWSISDGPIVRPPVSWGDKGFTFGDWLQPTGDTRKSKPAIGDDCAATLYHFISSDLMMRIADVLGNASDAEHYKQRADQIRAAFADEFITPSGRLAYSDQTSYALAFLHDLIPDRHIDAAKQYFRDSIAVSSGRIGTGFIGTPALLPALVKIGAVDLAAAVFLQTESPGWLYQVEQGATTIWERWDAIGPDGVIYDPEMNSYNHYAYGAVCQWLFESVAGFRPDPENPSFEHITFQPTIIPQLAPVQAHHDSAAGRISAKWSIHNGIVRYSVNIPEGARGTFVADDTFTNIKINGVAAAEGASTPLIAGHHEITFRHAG